MVSNEAAKIAYESGIRSLGSIVQRLMDAEALIQKMQERIEQLERKAPHLRKVETR